MKHQALCLSVFLLIAVACSISSVPADEASGLEEGGTASDGGMTSDGGPTSDGGMTSDGGPTSDGDATTDSGSETCAATCVGGTTCQPKACSTGSPETCTSSVATDETPCTENGGRFCKAGACVECNATNDGASCGGDGAHVCSNGSCIACTQGASCTPSNACHQGTTSCATGQQLCQDTGVSACGSSQYCSGTSCVACSPPPGTACTTPTTCHLGAEVCTASGASCQDTGSAADGTICNGSNECFGGVCETCGTINWPASNGWSAVSTTGPGHLATAMAYDNVHQRTILFGGQSASNDADNETFTWNGSSWSTATIASAPPGRSNSRMVFDSFHGKAVLFSGGNASTFGLPDTWTWDGVSPSWSQISCASNCPVGRDEHGLAYDSDDHVVILFGGETSPSVFNADTWKLDLGTNTWTPLSPSNSPPAGEAWMTYDSNRKVVVAMVDHASGGIGGLWEYSLANNTWTDRSSASPSPGVRSDPAIAYDASLKRTVLLGGCVEPGCSSGWLNDRWEWDGTCWRSVTNASKSPAHLKQAAMSYDSDHQKTIIFGGYNVDTSSYSNTTWQ